VTIADMPEKKAGRNLILAEYNSDIWHMKANLKFDTSKLKTDRSKR